MKIIVVVIFKRVSPLEPFRPQVEYQFLSSTRFVTNIPSFLQVVNLDVVRDAISQLELASSITREFLEVPARSGDLAFFALPSCSIPSYAMLLLYAKSHFS